jgi:hypothetical protein
MGKLGKTIAQIYWLCNHPIKLSNNFDKLVIYIFLSPISGAKQKKEKIKKGKTKAKKKRKRK